MQVWGLFQCDDLSHEGWPEGLCCLHTSWEAAIVCWANTWLMGEDVPYVWIEEDDDRWTLYEDDCRPWRALTIYPITVEN